MTKKPTDNSNANPDSIREHTLLQAVINAIPAPIFFKDAQGLYLGCNQAFEEFVGRRKEEMIGKGVFELWDQELAQIYYDADKALFEAGGRQSYEAQVTYADGSIHDVMFQKAVFFAEHENESGIVGVMLDITARKQAEAALAKMARTDPLTGLGNRTVLFEALHRLSEAGQSKGYTLLALDLDGFKAVNDQHGHVVGDAVLSSVARRLEQAVKSTDTLARVGGDEFFVILEGSISREQAAQVAERIIQSLARPFLHEDRTVHIGVSIGVAINKKGDIDIATLIKQADQALYSRKNSGKSGVTYYSPATQP